MPSHTPRNSSRLATRARYPSPGAAVREPGRAAPAPPAPKQRQPGLPPAGQRQRPTRQSRCRRPASRLRRHARRFGSARDRPGPAGRPRSSRWRRAGRACGSRPELPSPAHTSTSSMSSTRTTRCGTPTAPSVIQRSPGPAAAPDRRGSSASGSPISASSPRPGRGPGPARHRSAGRTRPGGDELEVDRQPAAAERRVAAHRAREIRRSSSRPSGRPPGSRA